MIRIARQRGRPRRMADKSQPVWLGQIPQDLRDAIVRELTPHERRDALVAAMDAKRATAKPPEMPLGDMADGVFDSILRSPCMANVAERRSRHTTGDGVNVFLQEIFVGGVLFATITLIIARQANGLDWSILLSDRQDDDVAVMRGGSQEFHELFGLSISDATWARIEEANERTKKAD